MTFALSKDSNQPGAFAQSDQSLCCPHEETLGLSYSLSAQRRLRSDWADAQADLSLCWAHRSFCWFCYEAAHFIQWFIRFLHCFDLFGKDCDVFLAMILETKSCDHMFGIFSSPEPSGSQGELIVYPYSGVRCRRRRLQQCLNIFSSETALPIKAKFYVEPPWEGGTKLCINGPGHMTKIAAMPIYGKNL